MFHTTQEIRQAPQARASERDGKQTDSQIMMPGGIAREEYIIGSKQCTRFREESQSAVAWARA